MRISRSTDKVFVIFFAFFVQFGYAAFQIDAPFSIGICACVIYMVRYVIKCREFVVPKVIIYMLIWITVCFCNALFIAPFFVGHIPKLLRIGYEAVYFLHLLVYMVVGFLIAKRGYGAQLLKYTAYFAAINSSLAILSELTDLAKFRELFYLSGAGIRFCGIGANPNDFMVQTLIGIAYFWLSKKEKVFLRMTALICLIYSTFAAGSKGGLIAIGIFAIIIFQTSLSKKVAGMLQRKFVKSMIVIVLIIAAFVTIRMGEQIGNLILRLHINGIDRVAAFFFDPLSNLDAGGSSRIKIWTGTLMVFMASPLIGCGIGSHERVQMELGYVFAELGTPHNIYLELLEQCGVIGFVWIASCFYKMLKKLNNRNEFDRLLKGVMTILLVNGLFFASDWSISFWIVLGEIFYQIKAPVIRLICSQKLDLIYNK